MPPSYKRIGKLFVNRYFDALFGIGRMPDYGKQLSFKTKLMI